MRHGDENLREWLFSVRWARRCLAAVVVGVMVATVSCVTGSDSAEWSPMREAGSESSSSSAADDSVVQEAVGMIGEDQRRAAAAMENGKPVVPYRDSPFDPLRRR